VARVSGQHGLRPPAQLVLLGKTLLNLDEVARTLDDDHDPNEMVRDSVADIMSKRLWREATPGSALNLLIDAKEFVEELPGRMNRILDTLADGQLRVEVDAVDEHELMRMAQKVANRVTAGLILAALIVGASMLMQVDVEPTLFGYPALAIVLFLAAAGAGFGLLLFIWLSDEHKRFRPKR
jgi:ubiquinone biosynthesis protein